MRRNGLTLVEVVVVIFLIAVVIALLIPVTQKVRSTDARTMTNENLRQCALAVHNYHDTYRRLPDAFSTGGIYSFSDRSMWFHLLPYVNSDFIYKAGLANARVPAFNAWNDPFNSDNAGIVNFAGNLRVFGNETITPAKANVPDIAIEVPEGKMRSGLTLPRIVDGAENVIMLTTRYSRCAGQTTWYASDPSGKWYPSGTTVGGDQKIANSPPTPGVGGFMGAGTYNTPPTSNAAPLTAMFQIAPTQANCVPQPGLFGHSLGIVGMSVALCDASVRNVSPTMSPRLYSLAVSPGDGQVGDWGDN